jgi:hypothetical protein
LATDPKGCTGFCGKIDGFSKKDPEPMTFLQEMG